jgi:hypothetical protein
VEVKDAVVEAVAVWVAVPVGVRVGDWVEVQVAIGEAV